MPNALVTGATGGIGQLIVARLAASGWNVVASGRNPQILASLMSLGHVFAYDGDLTLRGAPAALAQTAKSQLGSRLDCLIHCAGFAAHAPVNEVNADEVHQTLAVNAIVPIELTSVLIPLLARSDAPRIIFVGSILADCAMQNTGIYTSSKHAMRGYARSLRLECGSWLRVSEVDPGAIETAFLQNTSNTTARKAFTSRKLERLPAVAVANAVALIALEEDPNIVIERIVIVPFGQHRRALGD